MGNPVYDTPLQRIDGSDATLEDHAGQVLLVVNVASECGLTPQYEALQQLHQQYRDRGFSVIGFPANNFGAQEPGTNDEIHAFCTGKFGVEFPMYAKISVTGEDRHPLYNALVSAHPNRMENTPSQLLEVLEKNNLAPNDPTGVMWNFEKFLIGRDGAVLQRFAPDIAPDDERVTAAIATALA